jgi:hypothetical protein
MVQWVSHGDRMVEPLHVITSNLIWAALAITLSQCILATLTDVTQLIALKETTLQFF